MSGPLEITGISRLILGLLIGIVFGILLHKGKVTKYETIVGQFLLTDFTVLKVMLSAIIIGSIGIHFMVGMNLAQLHIKPLLMGGVIVGAIIFGIGMTILGYCPGTCIAAIGQGRIDALVGGIFGGLVGTGLYAHFYPLFKQTLLQWGVFEKLTLPQTLAASPWTVVVILVSISTLIFILLEKYENKNKS